MQAILSRPAISWPCLMYHQVLPGAPPIGASGYFAVTREQFAEQLDWLSAAGYRGVTIDEAVATPTEQTVAITFDDGDWTSYAVAFRELAPRRMTATFFVITSKVGTPGFATWEQLREMKSAGMSIQSHTHSHPFLSAIAKDNVVFELRESKRLLDSMLAQETVGISLPNGDHPHGGALAIARAIGYRWVATSQWGANRADRHAGLVRRYTVRRATTLDGFNTLVVKRPSALSREGLRLAFLHQLRALLGTGRYARWRRQVVRLRGG